MKSGKSQRLSKKEITERLEAEARLARHRNLSASDNIVSGVALATNNTLRRSTKPFQTSWEATAERRRLRRSGYQSDDTIGQINMVFRDNVVEVSRKETNTSIFNYKTGKAEYVPMTTVTYSFINKKSFDSSEVTMEAYHGTTIGGLGRIITDGIAPSSGGLLGPGTYVGPKAKAMSYTLREYSQNNKLVGAMVKCTVAPGVVKDVIEDWKRVPKPYDTLHGVPKVTNTWNGTLVQEEWCVVDPSRIMIESFCIYIKRR